MCLRDAAHCVSGEKNLEKRGTEGDVDNGEKTSAWNPGVSETQKKISCM